MGRYKVTAKTLREEIEHSVQVAELKGKHTEKLGYMLIELTGRLLNKTKVTLSKNEIKDIQSEMIIECLTMINRQHANMKNPFNYLYTCAKLRMFNEIRKVRRLQRTMKDLETLIKESEKELDEYITYEQ